MVKVFVNDVDVSLKKHFDIFSKYPRIIYSTEVFAVWETPFSFEPVIPYRLGVVFKSELEEAHSIVQYYGVTPHLYLKTDDVEIWEIPISRPLPSPKEKMIKIEKSKIPENLQLFKQRFLCFPKVISNLNPHFDLWNVPASY